MWLTVDVTTREQVDRKLQRAVSNAARDAWVPHRLVPGWHLVPVVRRLYPSIPHRLVQLEVASETQADAVVDLMDVALLWRLGDRRAFAALRAASQQGLESLRRLLNEACAATHAGRSSGLPFVKPVEALIVRHPVLASEQVFRAVATSWESWLVCLDLAPRWADLLDRKPPVSVRRGRGASAKGKVLRVLDGAVLLGVCGIGGVRHLSRTEYAALAEIGRAHDRARVAKCRTSDLEAVFGPESDREPEVQRFLDTVDSDLASVAPEKRYASLHLAGRFMNPTSVASDYLKLLKIRRDPSDGGQRRIVLAEQLKLHRVAHGWLELGEAAAHYGVSKSQLLRWEHLADRLIDGAAADQTMAWVDEFPVGMEAQAQFLQRSFERGRNCATTGTRERTARRLLSRATDIQKAVTVLRGGPIWEQNLGVIAKVAKLLGASTKMIGDPRQEERLGRTRDEGAV